MTDGFDKGIATRPLVFDFARSLRDSLPIHVSNLEETTSGRTETTRAVWHFFDTFRKQFTPEWNLYPKSPPTGGRVSGEFLIDFAVFDGSFGCRVACESEWGKIRNIDWAFDKLSSVKADIKVLIFQDDFSDDGELPRKLAQTFREHLGPDHHHCPGREFYLFFQFQGSQSRVYFWTPSEVGPFLDLNTIVFEQVDPTFV